VKAWRGRRGGQEESSPSVHVDRRASRSRSFSPASLASISHTSSTLSMKGDARSVFRSRSAKTAAIRRIGVREI